MNRFLSFVILSVSYLISLAQSNSFYLQGTVDSSLNGKPIMLFTFNYLDINKISSVDTTTVKDGTFYFEGIPCLNNISLVSIGNYPNKVLTGEVVLESGYITMNLDSVCRIGGTKLNDLYQQYKDSCLRISDLYKSDFQLFSNKEFAYIHPFIKSNIRNAVGRTLFEQQALGMYTLKNFNSLYELADDTLKKQERVMQALKHYKKRAEVEDRLNSLIGQLYQDFSFISIDGKEEKLSDYVGQSKYLLVDIWASWCAPCKAEMPAWKKLLEKHKEKDVMILGVSIDVSRKAWETAVRQLDTPWKQFVCQKDKAVLDEFYKLQGVPHTILIDQDGIIVGSKFNAYLLDACFVQGVLK